MPGLASARCASAIEKHDECAAAISSSGLVLPSERSVRDAHVTVELVQRSAAPVTDAGAVGEVPSHEVVAVRSPSASSYLPY